MERAVIGLLCLVLVVRLASGNPVYYQRATVMSKVEFSDRNIDGDRIDPLIEQSEEENGRGNEVVSTRMDMNGAEETDSKDITSVTEITINEPTTTPTTIGQDLPTQSQSTVNQANDKNSTEAEHGIEMTTATVIPKDETPPDLKPTLPSLYDDSTKDVDNSETNHLDVSTSDAEAAIKPVSTESSPTMTQTALPTEGQSETTQSVSIAVSETITNALELTSSLIVPAITDSFRTYSSSDVIDLTEELTKVSSSSPTEESISTVGITEEGTSSSLITTEEILLSSIDTNVIDTTANNQSSIEAGMQDSRTTLSSSTNGIIVTDKPEETITMITEEKESELSETTMMHPTFTAVATSDKEEQSTTETSTLQVFYQRSDITTRMQPEYSSTTTESYITTNHIDDADQPLAESETIETPTTTSVIATTIEETREENIDATTLSSSTESNESITDIEKDNVLKDYTTITVGSETTTSTLPVTIQPDSSAVTEGEPDSLTSTTDTPRLIATELTDGITTTVFITESSTSISYKAVVDSNAAPLTESLSTFQPTTEINEENDSHTTINNDLTESTDEIVTSAKSNNSRNPVTSAEDHYSTTASFTLTVGAVEDVATFAPSSTEVVTSTDDQQSTTAASLLSTLAIESTAEATTFPSSIYSTTDSVTLPEDEYTTLTDKLSDDASTSKTVPSSEDEELTTTSLFNLVTDITTPELPTSAENQHSTLASAENAVDTTTLIESRYTDADSSKSTEDQDSTITKYDSTIILTTLMPTTGDNIEIATFTIAATVSTLSTASDTLETSTSITSIETNDASNDSTTIPVTQGATTFTSSSEEVDIVNATYASHSITTSISEIGEDIATVATEEMSTGMDLIEDNESTTTSALSATVMSTINIPESNKNAKGSLPDEDDSRSYTTIDNEYVYKVTTVSSYDEDIRTEEITTAPFTIAPTPSKVTTVSSYDEDIRTEEITTAPITIAPTPYVETVNVSTENMPRTATSTPTNPISAETPNENPNTEESSTNISQEFSTTSKDTDSFTTVSVSDEERENSINGTTSPIESLSVDVTEQGVAESTFAKGTVEVANIDKTDQLLRSSGSSNLPSTILPPMTLATSTASPENASAASDRTTALNMYSHSIASVETIDPSTSMSVNEDDYASTSFALMTPQENAASLPSPTMLCFVATLVVLAISDNPRLHRRH